MLMSGVTSGLGGAKASTKFLKQVGLVPEWHPQNFEINKECVIYYTSQSTRAVTSGYPRRPSPVKSWAVSKMWLFIRAVARILLLGGQNGSLGGQA